MNYRNRNVAAIVTVIVLLAGVPSVRAQMQTTPAKTGVRAVMHDGHPALECRYLAYPTYTWTIDLTDLGGSPAFMVQVEGSPFKRGTLYISNEHIVLESTERPQFSFKQGKAGLNFHLEGCANFALYLQGHRYSLSSRDRYMCDEALPICSKFLESAVNNFPAALKQFKFLARGLPPLRNEAWRDFQPKAAAWRSLSVKPPIPDKVRQRRLLAEDAFNEKRFNDAAMEYEAGLEIDPLWPAGHYNAALIYAELKKYGDAAWHMRCYLELLPNAPDGQEARDSMLLWQGKAEEQATAPAAH
jgi:tetratricopeptide (TPR) repeat protein